MIESPSEARVSEPAPPTLSPKCDVKKYDLPCPQDAEFKVKIGKLWGHYCGKHTLEFMRSNNWNPEEEPIYPIDYDIGEEND